MANPENKGKRLAGAFDKGKAAAAKGQVRKNPYSRPNMLAQWDAGFDSVLAAEGEKGSE